MKPILNSGKMKLVPSAQSDLDWLCQFLWDADVRRYLCDDENLPKQTIRSFLKQSDDLDPQGLGFWIVRSESRKAIGLTALRPEFEGRGAGAVDNELLIAIDPETWGRGIAAATARTVLEYGFDRLGLNRIVAKADTPNQRSRRLLESCGFTETGTEPGPVHTLICYEIMPT